MEFLLSLLTPHSPRALLYNPASSSAPTALVTVSLSLGFMCPNTCTSAPFIQAEVSQPCPPYLLQPGNYFGISVRLYISHNYRNKEAGLFDSSLPVFPNRFPAQCLLGPSSSLCGLHGGPVLSLLNTKGSFKNVSHHFRWGFCAEVGHGHDVEQITPPSCVVLPLALAMGFYCSGNGSHNLEQSSHGTAFLPHS